MAEAGSALREWCAKNGMTQKALAERIGISEHHLSRVIVGHAKLSVETAKKISKITGIPAGKLLDI